MAVLIGTVGWRAGRGRWRGFLGIRFFVSYPPLWVAVIFGLAVWLAGQVWMHGVAHCGTIVDDAVWFCAQVPLTFWWASLPILVAVTVVALPSDLRVLARGRRQATGDPRSGSMTENDFDELRAWLRDDFEVSSPDRDLFKHDETARRIAARLQQEDEAPTMAVIGALGSGKSTIRRLVAHHLRRRPEVRIVGVSLWPFDSSEAAVRGILRAVVRELGRHVNVLPLVGLSGDYVTAIETTAGRYGGIARLLRASSDPEQILRRFSDIACAAGLRLVLWIEDLERFSGGDQLEGEQRIEREVERLGSIRALLHLLDRCPQISVVISDTSLRTRFDLGKIARFVEQPPALDAEQVWKVTGLLRDRCLGGYPVTVIDPASPKVREVLTPTRPANGINAWLSSFRDSHPSIPAAIAHTLRTPRALKSALRITLETWEKMPGEVDFDAVLVACVLRVTRPDLFALVSEHIELFRRGLTNPRSFGEDAGKPHRVVARIGNMLDREDERTAAALRALLRFLFPKYPPGQGGRDKEYVARPQAVFVDRHVDYWRRYLTQDAGAEGESDQKALASIFAWRDRESSDLIDRILDPRRSEQIKQFVGQFSPADLCRLLDETTDRLSAQSAAHWEHRADAPGLTSVWRMMCDRPPPEELVFRTVSDIVRRAVPANLPLAHDVCYFFTASGQGVPTLISKTQRSDVELALQGVLSANFTGDGAEERLLRALNDGSPWLIFWVAGRFAPVDAQSSVAFERWSDFANVLLNLAETHPAAGVPMVVPLVTGGNMAMGHRQNEEGELERTSEWVGQFDAESAKRLFDFDRLIRILATFEVPDDLDEEIKARCRAAIEAAKAQV